MSDTLRVIDTQITTIEQDLNADPRFRRLQLWRELRGTYSEGELASVQQLLPPPPAGRARKPRRKVKLRAAPKGKSAKRPPAAARRPRAQAAQEGGDVDAKVLAAIKQLQDAGKSPKLDALARLAKCSPSGAFAAIRKLVADRVIAPQGANRNRTYLLSLSKAEGPKPSVSAGGPAVETSKPVEAEPAAVKQRAGKPLPAGFDLDQFKRVPREVMLAMLACGDNAAPDQVAVYAEVDKERLPAVLTQLAAAGVAYLHSGKWSLTDLGHAVAMKVREDERG